MAGFQLWVNLAAKDKLTAPGYQDVPPADVPVVTLDDGVTVRVLAGETRGVTGAVTRPTTEPLYLDVTLPAGTVFDQPIPATHNAFVYVFGGVADVAGTPVESDRMAILSNTEGADGVRLAAVGDTPVRVLVVAGRPLNEPIVQYGPFVMNTQAEIHQAFEDFQRGTLAA